MTFKYFMTGEASLEVRQIFVSGGYKSLWIESRTTSNWTTARMNFNTNLYGYTLAHEYDIVVKAEEENKNFFVAVDSISVRNGYCPTGNDKLKL